MQLLHRFVPPEVVVDGGPEHDPGIDRRFLAGAGAAVRAVGRPLDEPEIPDVSRERRLGGLDPLAAQAFPQLLLARNGLAVDDLENRRLPV